MDILLVPAGTRLAETVAVLRDAADVYGWGISAADPADGIARVRVIPGTCTRQPEARRVLERARSASHELLADVEVVREEPSHSSA